MIQGFNFCLHFWEYYDITKYQSMTIWTVHILHGSFWAEPSGVVYILPPGSDISMRLSLSDQEDAVRPLDRTYNTGFVYFLNRNPLWWTWNHEITRGGCDTLTLRAKSDFKRMFLVQFHGLCTKRRPRNWNILMENEWKDQPAGSGSGPSTTSCSGDEKRDVVGEVAKWRRRRTKAVREKDGFLLQSVDLQHYSHSVGAAAARTVNTTVWYSVLKNNNNKNPDFSRSEIYFDSNLYHFQQILSNYIFLLTFSYFVG